MASGAVSSIDSQKDNDQSMDSDEEEEDKYVVEKILDRRIRNKKVEYFIKWKNYPETENTWEPEENCDCPDLINAFEGERKKKKDELLRTRKPGKKNGEQNGVLGQKQNGFERGKIPEKIIGATDATGELMFLIKW